MAPLRTQTPVFTAALSAVASTGRQPGCRWMDGYMDGWRSCGVCVLSAGGGGGTDRDGLGGIACVWSLEK